MDMFLIINGNISVNIEINNDDSSYKREKNLSYLCDLYNNLLLKVESYKKYKNALAVQLNVSKTNPEKKAISRYSILEVRNYNFYVKNFKIIDINMDKIIDELYVKNNKKD